MNSKKIKISTTQSEKLIKELAVKLRKRPKLSNQNFQILSSSAFLMLNNYFEYLITDLLTYHYNKYKGILSSKEFKISLKEIEEYDSISDLERNLILKEVETMILELSFDDLLKHFNTKFNICLSNEIINWNIITECRERRHLIVHNASMVNKKYLNRTSNPENKSIGSKLTISKDYFEKAFQEIRLAGLLLSYECWGKWDNDKASKAISDILDDTFEYLIQKDNLLSIKIASYTDKIEAKNEEEEDYLMRINFNRCIALKRENRTDELNKVLLKIKIGTSSPLFKLAHAILSDKSESEIIDLIEKSYKLEDIDIDSYSEWPLFEFIRSNKTTHKKVLQKFAVNIN